MTNEVIFAKEYWTGDSRDGVIVNGDGERREEEITGEILSLIEKIGK